MAVPNLLDSELADIYHLPSLKRLHAALNTPSAKKDKGKGKEIDHSNGTQNVRSGLIMSLHLRFLPDSTSADGIVMDSKLGLILGYEDGRVDIWVCDPDGEEKERWRIFSDGSGKVGNRAWELVWTGKGHNESG